VEQPEGGFSDLSSKWTDALWQAFLDYAREQGPLQPTLPQRIASRLPRLKRTGTS